MATRGEIGWQSEKTLVECMRYMLNNELATDVCFEVGPPDGKTVNIRAHKYMLIARSPVFEAMFTSGMIECSSDKDEKIRIKDISTDIFTALLRFIYTDDVEISPETAPSMMYAAKKYILPKLYKECNNLLQTSVKAENVCFLLDQSLLYFEKTLRDDCLKFICINSDEVLKSEKFLDSSRQALDAILNSEEMRSKESFVFQSCEKWAKHQLSLHKLIQNPSDEQIRETLGSLLYAIRFPTMDPEEFADLLGKRTVLTAEEKTSIYFYLIKNEKIPTLVFDVNKRHDDEKCVDRTIKVHERQWNDGPYRDVIGFRTDREVKLSGLGLFTGWNGNPYDVDVEILESGKKLFKKRFTIPFTGNSTPFKIPFKPICIRKGVIYTIVAFAQNDIGYFSDSCKAICNSDDITFTFSSSNDDSTTNENCGQIPQLFFF